MADQIRELGTKRQVIRVSSSISNFREKLKKRINYPEWKILDIYKECIFFGLYHIGDYLRFLIHQGKKKVFWCGSDILNLKNSLLWQYIIPKIKAKHFCENFVEFNLLKEMGIYAEVFPMIFDNSKIKINFIPQKRFHCYLSCHKGREKEYGVDLIEMIAKDLPDIIFHIYGISKPFHEVWQDRQGRIYNLDYINNTNIIYHGKVSNEQFNEEIKNYHCGLRLNEFDGFSEITAKSILMGQYPITKMYYPGIDCVPNKEILIEKLKLLSQKKKPNIEMRKYWILKLKESLIKILE